eukprot:1195351-Prorocentrum_minimum.AAC.4
MLTPSPKGALRGPLRRAQRVRRGEAGAGAAAPVRGGHAPVRRRRAVPGHHLQQRMAPRKGAPAGGDGDGPLVCAVGGVDLAVGDGAK